MGKFIKAIVGLGLVALAGYLIYNGFTWLGGALGVIGMIIGGAGAVAIVIGLIALIVKAIFTDSSW